MASMRSMMVKILLIYLMSGCDKANGRCRSAKGTCPSDWNQWGDNCYKVIEPRSWSQVRDECVRIGGIMVTPNSLEENTYIKSLDSRDIWINCNDLETEGKLQNYEFKSWAPKKVSGFWFPALITSDPLSAFLLIFYFILFFTMKRCPIAATIC